MDVLRRYSAGARDDVPKDAPTFGQHPATNERRMVRYGRNGGVPESKQQLLINALRGRVDNSAAVNRNMALDAAENNLLRQQRY